MTDSLCCRYWYLYDTARYSVNVGVGVLCVADRECSRRRRLHRVYLTTGTKGDGQQRENTNQEGKL